MSDEEIKNAIFAGLRKIAPETDPSSLRLDQNIRETLDIDSFDFLNFLIALDENLGVEIPEADYGKLATLEAMIRYIHTKV
jgi:acyl carrier protein